LETDSQGRALTRGIETPCLQIDKKASNKKAAPFMEPLQKRLIRINDDDEQRERPSRSFQGSRGKAQEQKKSC
jgi:hypothetical protein